MKLTEQMLMAGASAKGGWNADQLRALGFPGFKEKWKDRAIGMWVTDEQYKMFLSLKDKHLVEKFKKNTDAFEADAWAVRNREKLLSKTNEAEERIEKMLGLGRLSYVREMPLDVGGKKWFVDFYINGVTRGKDSLCVALEVDGGYHFTKEQQELDARKDSDLLTSKAAKAVLRINIMAAMNMNQHELAGRIVNAPPGTVTRCYPSEIVRVAMKH